MGGPTALFLEGASSPSGVLRLCGSEFRSRRAGQTLHGLPRGAENEHISV
ncbi:zinc finger protein 782 [Prionailurus iriomotensis]